METKLNTQSKVLSQNNVILDSMKKEEMRYKTEINSLKNEIMDLNRQNKEKEYACKESHQQLALEKAQTEEILARVSDLKRRLKSNSEKLQQERAARLGDKTKAIDRARAVAGGSNAKAASSSSSGDTHEKIESSAMEMQLRQVLYCSICNTDFKNCVITRCWHMFCKGCIDNNLANRNRKCPACGDKFGADDVQTVYLGEAGNEEDD